MKTKTIQLNTIEKSFLVDVYNKELLVAKMKTHKWLLIEKTGEVLKSCRSESKILEFAAKLEERRARGNLHGLPFGGRVNPNIVRNYVQTIWGGIFDVEDVDFSECHYWVGNVCHLISGKRSEKVRLDYLVNYMRVPHGLETAEGVHEQLIKHNAVALGV